MNNPVRVQRKRTRGFKLPENTVCVTRGTKFGNPFKVGKYFAINGKHGKFELYPDAFGKKGYEDFVLIENNAMAVTAFENYLKFDYFGKQLVIEAKEKLKGKNLACFCKESDPCHVDIWLKLVNDYRT